MTLLAVATPRGPLSHTHLHKPQPQEPAAKKQRVEVNGGGDEPASATVFVGNLPWSATEEELREFFAECGDINSVRIGERQTEDEARRRMRA